MKDSFGGISMNFINSGITLVPYLDKEQWVLVNQLKQNCVNIHVHVHEELFQNKLVLQRGHLES